MPPEGAVLECYRRTKWDKNSMEYNIIAIFETS